MPGKLTTHVLDTAQGRPAAGVELELWRIDNGGRRRDLLAAVCTNADGRTDTPLLAGEALQPGTYELQFAVGAYFANQHLEQSDPPFLNRVPVRFTISNANAHYHVPLLVSPWAYSTYRGS